MREKAASVPGRIAAGVVSIVVLVRDFKTEKTFIITRSDIMRVLM